MDAGETGDDRTVADTTASGRVRSEASLVDALDSWRSGVLNPFLNQHPEIKPAFLTGSREHEAAVVYTPLDNSAGGEIAYLEKVGLPGSFPFTRGRLPSGHRSLPWKLGFYSGFGNPADANARIRQLAEAGTSYVTLAFDLPSQCGYDPDHELASGDVGRVGISIASLRDLEEVLDGVPLLKVGTGTVGNCIEPIMVGMFSLVASRQNIDPGKVHITLQNDPLKEYTGRGTYIIPIEPAVELAADVTEFCVKNRPNWIPQYACTTQLRWGGVTASEEIAFGISNLFAYVDRVVARGLDPTDVLPRLEGLHMTVDDDFFEEVAKLRATRRLWARLASERYSTNDPRVLGLKLTVFTGAHRMTAQQPLNNITRTAIHVLAALVGGAERISTPAYDEALALPTEESTRVANLTKLILLYENGITNTVDPLGGSYYVEHLTDELEERAVEVFRQIEAEGGAIAAIEAGHYEKAMLRGMKSQTEQIERGDRTVIGVNAYERDEPEHFEVFAVNDSYEALQKKRLAKLRAERNDKDATQALAQLRSTLQQKKTNPRVNSIEAFTAAVASLATIGEMSNVMREVYGEYRPAFGNLLR